MLYLSFRHFVADALSHFHYEETVILKELQRLYSDEEIRLIDKESYDQMQPDQMLHMLKILFPSINAEDKSFFINELKLAAPEKVAAVWHQIEALA